MLFAAPEAYKTNKLFLRRKKGNYRNYRSTGKELPYRPILQGVAPPRRRDFSDF